MALQLVVGFEVLVLEVLVLLAAKERTWRSGKVIILWPANKQGVLEGMMEWDLVLKWNSQFEWRIGAPMLIVFS